MKRLFSIALAILLASLTIGCNTTTHADKETYNMAYVTIPFITEDQKQHVDGNGDHDFVKIINKCSSSNWYSDNNVFVYIDDWNYGENDTIVLYLTDGRTIQTASCNVLLVNEPDIR